MKTITFLNEKGGVGKTTLSITMAAGLAIKGANVLLIDTDAQGHVSVALGMPEEAGLYDLMIRNAPFAKVLREVAPERYAPEGKTDGRLVVLPSNEETRNIANSMGDGFKLANRLAQLQNIFDYIIIDTSPTPSLLHSTIYAATDWAIHPTKLETLSFNGLKKSMEHLEGLSQYFSMKGFRDPIRTIGIVPNIVEMNTLEHADNFRELRQHFPDLVWRPIVKSTIWRETVTAAKSIFAYVPGSQVAETAWKFCQQLEAVDVK